MSAIGYDRPLAPARPRAVPGARAWREYAVALLLILVAASAVHSRRFQANLHRHHWEDWRFFRHVRTQIHTPIDSFTRPGPWPGLYRPLSTNLYYFEARKAFDTHVEAYHWVNAALFVANALLLFGIARQLLPSPWRFVPPTLFASRLAHWQLLLYTSEVQALLSTSFALVSIHAFVAASRAPSRRKEAASALALALGLLSKETVVVVPALLTVQCLLWERPPRWQRLVAPWVTAAVLAGVFVAAWRWVGDREPTGFTYDVSWAVAGRLAAYLLSFVNPIVWTIDSPTMASHVLAWSGRPWLVALVIASFVGALAAAVHWSRPAARSADACRVAALGLAWCALGLAPFVFFADRLFMRYTYFGHAGLALASAAGAWLAVETVRSHRPHGAPHH